MNAIIVSHLFTQGDNKQPCRLCLHTILYAERQVGSCEHQFSEVFGMTRPGIELWVYRYGGKLSTTRPTIMQSVFGICICMVVLSSFYCCDNRISLKKNYFLLQNCLKIFVMENFFSNLLQLNRFFGKSLL